MSSTVSPPRTPRTNLGPLTTTFTPPGSCAVPEIRSSGLHPGFYVMRPGSLCELVASDRRTVLPAVSCFPSPLGSFFRDGIRSTQPVFSPGSVCPAGYVAACTESRANPTEEPPALVKNPDTDLRNLLFEGETATVCCPSGFDCAPAFGFGCIMMDRGTPGQVIAGYSYDSNCATLATIAIVPAMYVPDDGIVGFARRIVLVNRGSPSTGGAAQPPPGPTVRSHSTQSTTSSAGSDGPENITGDVSGGLTTSAKIGIGVAVPFVVILITAAFVFVFWARRKPSQRPTASGGMAPGPAVWSKPELEGSGGPALAGAPGAAYGKPELENSQVYEMDPAAGVLRPTELHGCWDYQPQLDPASASRAEVQSSAMAPPHMGEAAGGSGREVDKGK
ncbi:hypothetical protein N658DRAFT_509604 [Parathielavia hyrcaniae]|uniref:Uncharacterized protein n=1 Tax=Parathielavia hyrcaniae TaxID=113614 RepID=A0AAN6PVB0_9PEZI|nr:hypothetical protein N658DRAFT_509604 [Parathielavia hyrcaniae]